MDISEDYQLANVRTLIYRTIIFWILERRPNSEFRGLFGARSYVALAWFIYDGGSDSSSVPTVSSPPEIEAVNIPNKIHQEILQEFWLTSIEINNSLPWKVHFLHEESFDRCQQDSCLNARKERVSPRSANLKSLTLLQTGIFRMNELHHARSAVTPPLSPSQRSCSHASIW